jgi:uncharacterized protein with FMN-binding domain
MRNFKKIALSLGMVAAFIAYSWQQRHDDSPAAMTAVTPSSETKNSTASRNTPDAKNSASGHKQTGSAYMDGVYTGSSEDAYYGFIQVRAVISGGKITDVKFLQYPDDQENSIYINQQAMPYLKQEAIAIQGANVNIITGATDTTQAFVRSMDDALNQAKRG